MHNIVGVFTSREEAEKAAERLRSLGIPPGRVDVLSPGGSENKTETVRSADTEQPGMGRAVGGLVGGAVGAATGLPLGAAAASLFVPGVGPILAAGLLGAAVLGITGSVAGGAVGQTVDQQLLEGVPRDELFVYEDALRQGRSVVVALTEDEALADAARREISNSGAEALDTAREQWWVGLRPAEEEGYLAEERDFKQDEPVFRRGFEAALQVATRGNSYDQAQPYLQQHYPEIYRDESFRIGYERGQAYYQRMSETHPRP